MTEDYDVFFEMFCLLWQLFFFSVASALSLWNFLALQENHLPQPSFLWQGTFVTSLRGIVHVPPMQRKKKYISSSPATVPLSQHILLSYPLGIPLATEEASYPTGYLSVFTSWWLNQPLWKIWSSNWVHLPPRFGVKIKKYLSCHHL